MLAYIIEDVTLVKIPAEGTTKIHVRFKGGKTETLTTQNPKILRAAGEDEAGQIVELVDQLLDDHIYSEIAEHAQRARASSGRVRPTGTRRGALHRDPRRVSGASVRAPLTL